VPTNCGSPVSENLERPTFVADTPCQLTDVVKSAHGTFRVAQLSRSVKAGLELRKRVHFLAHRSKQQGAIAPHVIDNAGVVTSICSTDCHVEQL